MKKAFALLLTLAMIATLSVVTFAANPQDLTATYKLGDDVDTLVYSLDVSWNGDTEFKYIAGTATWNPDPEVLDYEFNEDGEWEDRDLLVTVTNKSNAGVKTGLALSNKVDGLAFLIDEVATDFAEKVVASADNTDGEEGAAVVKTVEYIVSIDAASVPTAGGTVATATVSFAAVPKA